jgi:hypothetical protein
MEHTTLDALQRFLAMPEQMENPQFVLELPVDFKGRPFSGSCLTEAIFLPFNSSRTEQDALEFKLKKSRQAFKTLSSFIHTAIKAAKITPEAYTQLLLASNKNNFNLLQDAAGTSNLELVKHIFSEVRQHVGNQYPEMLSAVANENFTLLQLAVSTGNLEVIKYVFDEVRRNIGEKYGELLVTTTRENFTLLQQAADTGNLEVAKYVFDEVRKNTGEKFRELLGASTKNDFTLLQEAVHTGNLELTKYVFEQVSKHVGGKYSELLAIPAANNFTILHEAVNTDNVELAKFVFDKVRKRLPEDTVKQFMQAHTSREWNLFHTATQFEDHRHPSEEMVGFLINQFYEVFNGVSWTNAIESSKYDPTTDKARQVIEKLYPERTNKNIPAFHDQQPEWLRRILELDGRTPVQPTPWAAR